MSTLLKDLNKKILILDGAMGTEIQKRIENPGINPELLNISHPDTIMSIHNDYEKAGSNIITSNTFGANGYKLKKSGYAVEEIIKKGIQLVKSSTNAYCALDIGPIGVLINNDTEYDFDFAYNIFKEQIIAGRDAGCDLILIETMTDIYEAKAAVLAAKENSDLPVICSMTLQENGRTLTGTDIITIVSILESLGTDVIGLNCSFGPDEMIPFIEEMAKYSSTNIIIQPNAGLPKMVDGVTVFDLEPKEYASTMNKIKNIGVNILGGCCGTTPEHIKVFTESIDNTSPTEITTKNLTFVSSSTKTVIVDGVKIIGERINPTGKKKLREAIKNYDLEYIAGLAKKQEKEGADILDINVGVPGIDEIQTMEDVIMEVSKHSSLPLQIDSSDYEAIDNALRKYNGKAMVNSVNGKKESLENILPLIQKYGSCLVGLTMDDSGIPGKSSERFKIAQNIVEEAEKYGICRKDIFIDCLTLTASAQQEDVFDTLIALSRVKNELGTKTCLGVSNVSYGLPKRDLLTTAFLTSALTMGLDAPIMNPASESSMDAIRAYKVLKNIDRDSADYIEFYNDKSKTDNKTAAKQLYESDVTLKQAIVSAMKVKASELTAELLKEKTSIEIINEYIAPALDEVGIKYETGEIFLPQLLLSAETVQGIFKIIKENSKSNAAIDNDKRVLLATVQGDVHDIGKSIVKMLLDNYGFDVVDLGKDVAIGDVVKAAKEENIKLVGLSALMTTTVANMKKTIEAISKEIPDVKIMVGGAVLTEEYSREINADFYGKDALAAVALVKEFYSQQ
jgi:5-methyltetrahydrofolate--homocysteine methyltransferase